MMQLLEHFKELTLHPKNAQELKGLILQLAMQGKLTRKWREENPNVESCSVLLEKLKGEKQRLIKEKVIKNEKEQLEINPIYYPYNVPKTWTWRWLTSLFYSIGNRENQLKSSEYLSEGIYPIVDQGKTEIVAYSNDKSKLLEIGHPVIVFGDHTRQIKFIDFDFIIGADGTQILKPYQQIDPIFFYFQLCSYDIEARGYSRHFKILKEKLFALPPFTEQKAIVEVVNQLFAEVEQLETLTKERIQLKADFVTSSLNQLTQAAEQDTASQWAFLQQHFNTFFTEKENIKKLREGILQLAVQGKLTRDWRTIRKAKGMPIEPASTLLEKIKAEKEQLIKAGKIKKEKPLPEISEEEIPYELPEGWVWCKMDEFVRFMAYGTSQKTNDNYNDVPVLRMGNLTSEGELHFRNLKYIPENHPDLPKLYLKPGDLVFNRTNSFELVGKSGVFKGEDKTYTLASYLIKVSLFNEYIDSDYINTYIVSSVCRKTQIEPQITAQTNQANFSGSKLKEVLVPLAPLQEQKAIVEKVKGLMAICDRLEQEIENHQTTQEQWMQSCLREVVNT